MSETATDQIFHGGEKDNGQPSGKTAGAARSFSLFGDPKDWTQTNEISVRATKTELEFCRIWYHKDGTKIPVKLEGQELFVAVSNYVSEKLKGVVHPLLFPVLERFDDPLELQALCGDFVLCLSVAVFPKDVLKPQDNFDAIEAEEPEVEVIPICVGSAGLTAPELAVRAALGNN